MIETACQRLRLDPNLTAIARSEAEGQAPKGQGVAISIVASEVDTVGGFRRHELLGAGTERRNPAQRLRLYGSSCSRLWRCRARAVHPAGVLHSGPAAERSTGAPRNGFGPYARSPLRSSTPETAKPTIGEKTYRGWVSDVYRLNMEIYRRKFGMNFPDEPAASARGDRRARGRRLVSLARRNGDRHGRRLHFRVGAHQRPWNDFVDFFRNLANAGVKYVLIVQVLDKESSVSA